MSGPTGRPGAPIPARAGWVTSILAVAMIGAFVAQSDQAWPFTAWKLFSQQRGPVSVSWTVTGVSPSGATVVDFDSLGRGYRGSRSLLHEMRTMEPAERAPICEAWKARLRETGVDVSTLRISRSEHVRPLSEPGRSSTAELFRC